MRSAWITQVGPKSNDKCPYKTEAEVGAVLPQTRNRLEPPEPRRGKAGPPYGESRPGAGPRRHPHFRFTASRTARRHCCRVKPPRWRSSAWQSEDTSTLPRLFQTLPVGVDRAFTLMLNGPREPGCGSLPRVCPVPPPES